MYLRNIVALYGAACIFVAVPAQARDDCPSGYSKAEDYECEDICEEVPGGILCTLGDYGSSLVAVEDTTNGPFIWGVSVGFASSTIFCCDYCDIGGVDKLWVAGGDRDDTIRLNYNRTENWHEDSDINGGDGSDTIIGSNDFSYSDDVSGGAGADFISAMGGDDVLSGGSGSDEIHGGYGGDVIDGGDNDDWLNGDAGSDEVVGGLGDDIVCGSNDSTWDYLNGTYETESDDHCYGDSGDTKWNCTPHIGACPSP